MTPEERKAEFNKLAPVAIKDVAGLIDGNFAEFQKAQEDYRSQLPVGDPRMLEPALIPADFLSEEGMKQRGLLDEKGEATKLGEDYLLMEDEGFMRGGQLTEKGKAYTADPDELLPVDEVNDWTIFTNTFDIDEKTKLPSDPEVLSKFRQFQVRKKEGLDKVEGGNVFSELGKGLLSAIKGVYVYRNGLGCWIKRAITFSCELPIPSVRVSRIVSRYKLLQGLVWNSVKSRQLVLS